jgi:hypothetical protein
MVLATAGLAGVLLVAMQLLPVGEGGSVAYAGEAVAGQAGNQESPQAGQAVEQGAHEGTQTAAGPTAPIYARALGDIVDQFSPPAAAPGYTNHCSIGVAFDGRWLYYTRCGDKNIYAFRPDTPNVLRDTFDTGIDESPAALAYDRKRHGLWFGTQGCNASGMPIYFWSFGTDTVSLEFTIPYGLTNPATGQSFLYYCLADGVAFSENDPSTIKDDEIWFSDDVNKNLGVFSTTGALLRAYDATTIDASFINLAGLAIGGPNLYMSNDGSQGIFRVNSAVFQSLGSFATLSDRLEDMECDPVSYAPTEVMWVRSTPQSVPADDLFTAFEIEPGTCQIGGGGSFHTFIGDEEEVGGTDDEGG